MAINPAAGQPAEASNLVNVPRLVTAYFPDRPDPEIPEQRVSFGTSGHRGSSLHRAFNEWHILAITQAICAYRKEQGIDGPLFLGIDTHALSEPAFASALEVLAANDVHVRIAPERRVHADAGDFARDSELQPGTEDRTGRRHRGHAFAQSARGWRLQVQSAARWTGGQRRSPGSSRRGPMSCSKTA